MTDGDIERDDNWTGAEEDGPLIDRSDSLDDDPAGDPDDVGYEPADRYSGVNRFGTTPAEEAQGESLDERLSEEEPDFGAGDDEDTDEDELTRRGYDEDPRAGRLIAEDEGLGPDEDDQAFARDAGIDYGGASAEEAAVHVVDDPNGPGTGPEL